LRFSFNPTPNNVGLRASALTQPTSAMNEEIFYE
jgi:hypothetical protein